MPTDDLFNEAWDVVKIDTPDDEIEKGLLQDFRAARQAAEDRANWMAQWNPTNADEMMQYIADQKFFAGQRRAAEAEAAAAEAPPPETLDLIEDDEAPESESLGSLTAEPEPELEVEEPEPESKESLMAEPPVSVKPDPSLGRGRGTEVPIDEPEPETETEMEDLQVRADDEIPPPVGEGFDTPGEEEGAPLKEVVANWKSQLLTLDDPKEVQRMWTAMVLQAQQGQESALEALNQFNNTSELAHVGQRIGRNPDEMLIEANEAIGAGMKIKGTKSLAQDDRQLIDDSDTDVPVKLPPGKKKGEEGQSANIPEKLVEANDDIGPDEQGNMVLPNPEKMIAIVSDAEKPAKHVAGMGDTIHIEEAQKLEMKGLGHIQELGDGTVEYYPDYTRDEYDKLASVETPTLDNWNILKDPFANPFGNPNFNDLNSTQPPGRVIDTTPTDLIKEEPPVEGFREGDDLSLLPSAPRKGEDRSLLPKGWDNE